MLKDVSLLSVPAVAESEPEPTAPPYAQHTQLCQQTLYGDRKKLSDIVCSCGRSLTVMCMPGLWCVFTLISVFTLALERMRRRSHYLREATVTAKARAEALRCESAGLKEEMRRLTSTSSRLIGRLQHTTTAIFHKLAVLQSSESLRVCKL